jgi:hypothetical protein
MHLRLRPYAVIVLTPFVVLVAADRSSAQSADGGNAPRSAPAFSVTPFVAMGDDLAPGAGGAVSYAWTLSLMVEAEASLGADAARSSVSLLYMLPRLGKRVYVAGGLGVQRHELEKVPLNDLSPAPGKKTEFAVNIGAGITIPIGRDWSYRSDFRWYDPAAEWPKSWRVFSGFGIGLPR